MSTTKRHCLGLWIQLAAMFQTLVRTDCFKWWISWRRHRVAVAADTLTHTHTYTNTHTSSHTYIYIYTYTCLYTSRSNFYMMFVWRICRKKWVCRLCWFLHYLRCLQPRHGKSDGEELSKLILKEPDLWRRHLGNSRYGNSEWNVGCLESWGFSWCFESMEVRPSLLLQLHSEVPIGILGLHTLLHAELLSKRLDVWSVHVPTLLIRAPTPSKVLPFSDWAWGC